MSIPINDVRKITFYKYNNTNQKTEIIQCNIAKAHELFNTEYEKMQNNESEFNYMDITATYTGAMLKSYSK